MSMVNLGIAGMGYMGRVHLEASQKVPEARVLAVATAQPEKVRSAYPGLQIYPSYEELVRDDRLDAIVICVPTYLHEQVAVAAAEWGRHILCEKAMALDAASAQRMLQAARARGLILMVAHVLRFWAQYARIRELVDAGEIGAIRSITARRLATYPPWGDWFRDPAKSGGGILDLQIHDVDFIHGILGHPRSVYTVGIQSPRKSWDHVHTTLTYPGAQATLEASLMMPKGWPFSTDIGIVGTEGALEYTFRVGENIQQRDQAAHSFRLYKSDGTTSEPATSPEDMFVAQLRYFVRCVAEREPPHLCPPEETYQVMQVMSASRLSADSGRIIALDTDEPVAAP
ncbi:MAG: Gfo/Idh/MocA family oxidoreductase [Terriglobia bacterium]|jgi:predicted dehydrogenase